MSRHDGKKNAQVDYSIQLRRAMAALLPRLGLRLLPDNNKERWTPRYLVITAILIACLGTDRLVDRFQAARTTLVRMYLTRRRPGESYQGFAGALRKAGDALLEELAWHLRVQVQEIAGDRWLIDGWLVFGCDGSRFDKTRTLANKQAFGSGGRSKSGPQQFVTTLFHVGTGLPWCWRAGNASASERSHLLQMLEKLPEEALLLLDAGYVGHSLLRAIMNSERSFILRVGANIELLTRLGWDYRESWNGIVSLWPKHARERGAAPLTLRLVTIFDRKGRRMDLLTNVLAKSRLSDAAVSRMYRKRWGVEVLYRSIKQTMQLRKALSWSPESSEQELHWGMMGVWMLGLMALREQPQAAGEASECRWSAAETLRVIRRVIRGSLGRGKPLSMRLSRAVLDGYCRHGPKRAREPVNKKREKPPGIPRQRRATRPEKRAAARLKAVA